MKKARKSPPSRTHLKLTDMGIMMKNSQWHFDSALRLLKKSIKELELLKVKEAKLKTLKQKKI